MQASILGMTACVKNYCRQMPKHVMSHAQNMQVGLIGSKQHHSNVMLISTLRGERHVSTDFGGQTPHHHSDTAKDKRIISALLIGGGQKVQPHFGESFDSNTPNQRRKLASSYYILRISLLQAMILQVPVGLPGHCFALAC